MNLKHNDIESFVKKAVAGDKHALEKMIFSIQDLVYNLSIKMLKYEDDASDATQEILVKVITHLSSFNHQSKFTTWVYRVAINYLLTLKDKKRKGVPTNFEDYEKLIDTSQSDSVLYTENEGEISLLEEEVMLGCTQGVLMCLEEQERMIFIMSVFLNFKSSEGAEIVGITPENFRKKLSRGKNRVRNFLDSKCGLVNPDNPCRCRKKIDYLIKIDLLNPNNTVKGINYERADIFCNELTKLQDSLELYRNIPEMPVPSVLLTEIRKMLEII